MTKTQDIEQLRRRSEKVYSNGKILDYKLYGNTEKRKYYQHYSPSDYNEVQDFLYKRARFGLSIFEQEEIKTMHFKKRKRIIKTQKRTQNELNIWKQKLINKATNELFLELFPNSSLAQELLNTPITDPMFKNKLSFKELGIQKDAVVERLYNVGILPKSFYQIK